MLTAASPRLSSHKLERVNVESREFTLAVALIPLHPLRLVSTNSESKGKMSMMQRNELPFYRPSDVYKANKLVTFIKPLLVWRDLVIPRSDGPREWKEKQLAG